jgi:diadenosine tetraphosphate (Ap4A) HIT family hydrolase
MNGQGREIIVAVGNAARSFVAHVDMGLLPAYSGNGAPSQGPTHPGGGGPHPGGGGPPPPPAAASARKKGSSGEGAAAPAGKRARTQESDAPAAKSRAIAVTVDGDLVRTR